MRETNALRSRAEPAPPAIEVRGVSKSYATSRGLVAALSPTTFTVAENEFVTILGPSGCGKSTILTLIAGLEAPTTGRILIHGQPVAGPGRDRGFVFQSYTLFPWLTAADNIAFGLRLAGVPEAEVRRVVARYVSLIGLEGSAQRYPHELSGGMRQRVAIARALATGPRVLLMDEPFGALDAQTRLAMQELLRSVWQADRTTVLFVTHDVEEAVYLGERVLVLAEAPGRLRAEYRVTLPPERPPEVKEEPEFLALKRELLALLRQAWADRVTRTGAERDAAAPASAVSQGFTGGMRE